MENNENNQSNSNNPVKTDNTKKRILMVLVFIAAFVIATVLVRVLTTPSKSDEVKKGVEQVKGEIKLQTQVDQITTLNDIKADGDKIRNEYIVKNVKPSDVDINVAKESTKKTACSNVEIMKVLKKDIDLTYNYSFEGTDQTLQFEIKQSDC